MSRRLIGRIVLATALGLLALIGLATAVFAWQGSRTPTGRPEYVALGSSFAAGAGLGPLQKNSPLLCARSVGGYPQHLARMHGLSIVDMSCGGAVTKHVLTGGQAFQGAQLRTINGDTRLVTLTIGGNDIGYVGDLSLLAARKDGTLFGWLVRRMWKGPRAASERDWAKLEGELLATLRAIRERAPDAVIVVATYPTLLPSSGTCDRIGLTVAEADLMRQVGNRLATVTRSAARQGGAAVVDMHRLGATHHACSAEPWVNGWKDAGPAPFHPTTRGAEATAETISVTLERAAT